MRSMSSALSSVLQPGHSRWSRKVHSAANTLDSFRWVGLWSCDRVWSHDYHVMVRSCDYDKPITCLAVCGWVCSCDVILTPDCSLWCMG